MKKLTVEETIKAYTSENGFAWGINTVMKSLAPNASYDLTSAGQFIIDRWDSPLPQPTSQEIRDEYIRQQTIAECLKYSSLISCDVGCGNGESHLSIINCPAEVKS
jgi:hypothetical protein